MTSNQPRVALVTGANRGIGLEVARQLAQHGLRVIVTGRNEGEIAAAATQLVAESLDVLAMPLDVASDASVAALAARVQEEVGGLDVLVNNAAVFSEWAETASEANLDAARALVDVNLFGSWRTARALLPLLRQGRHPRLVNVSSGAGSYGDLEFGLAANGGAAASYAISKAALNALTSTLAAELADTPVLVNAVCPGLTATSPEMEGMGARPLSEGAASVTWAALLPDDGPRGGFFRDGAALPW